MGSVGTVYPAAQVAGVFYRDKDVYRQVLEILTERFSPLVLDSGEFDFTMTEYYEREMGAGLKKRFLCFEQPADLDNFPEVKLFTNNLERQFAVDTEYGFDRRINIDPGYLTLPKLVLASTKNFHHRIYIGKGIYAEVTLRYYRGAFIPLETTFPDYKTSLAIDFFTRVRDYVQRNKAKWTSVSE